MCKKCEADLRIPIEKLSRKERIKRMEKWEM